MWELPTDFDVEVTMRTRTSLAPPPPPLATGVGRALSDRSVVRWAALGLAVVGCLGCQEAVEPRAVTRPPPEVATPAQRAPVELRLSASAEIAIGEPVMLTLELTNVSAAPVNLPWPGYVDGFVTSQIRAADGAVTTIEHPGGALGHGEYPGGDLAADESITLQLEHVFAAVGDVTVVCVLDTTVVAGSNIWGLWEGRAESPAVTVRVR